MQEKFSIENKLSMENKWRFIYPPSLPATPMAKIPTIMMRNGIKLSGETMMIW